MQHFMDRVAGKTFGKDEARDTVIPVYMGLISQIDDQLGIAPYAGLVMRFWMGNHFSVGPAARVHMVATDRYMWPTRCSPSAP